MPSFEVGMLDAADEKKEETAEKFLRLGQPGKLGFGELALRRSYCFGTRWCIRFTESAFDRTFHIVEESDRANTNGGLNPLGPLNNRKAVVAAAAKSPNAHAIKSLKKRRQTEPLSLPSVNGVLSSRLQLEG